MASNLPSEEDIIELSAEITRDQLKEHLDKSISELSYLCNSCEYLLKNMEEVLKRIRVEQQRAIAIIKLEASHSFNR
jgi:hypothetical protein